MPLFSHSLCWPHHGSFLLIWNRVPQSHFFTQNCFVPETIMPISFSPYFLLECAWVSSRTWFLWLLLLFQTTCLAKLFTLWIFPPPHLNLCKLLSSQQTNNKKNSCQSYALPQVLSPTWCPGRLSYVQGLYILVSWTPCHPPLELFWPESPVPF